MDRPRTSTSKSRSTWRARLGVAALLTAVLGAAGYTWTHQHVTRVSLERGGSRAVEISVPLRRRGEPMGLVDRGKQPVTCRIAGGDDKGVRVFVAQTRHTPHWLTARVIVEVGRNAELGRHRRSLSFSISGEGGWPEATLVVSVRE